MGKFAGLSGGNARILLGLGVAGGVLFGGYLYLSDRDTQPEEVALAAPEPITPAASEPAPEPQSEPLKVEPELTPADTAGAETVPEAAPVEQIAEPEHSEPEPKTEPESSELSEAPEPTEPEVALPTARFDLVRVEHDGNTLIAGQAAPDTEVVIMMDGEELDRVTSDGAGKFVSFLSLPNSQNVRVLNLVSRHASGDVTSEDQVILAPSAAPEVAVADAETSSQGEAEPEVAASSNEPTETLETTPQEPEKVAEDATPEVPAITQEGATVPEPEEPTAIATLEPTQPAPEVPSEATPAPAVNASPPNPVTVLRADADGVEVLQPATSDVAPEVMTSVALDAISYSDVGEVSLSGRAPDQGSVRVYLDNAPITTLEVDETGRWRGELPQVETGVYTLRIDQVDASGAVTSRVETPFKREEPEVLSAALEQAGNSDAQVSAITVQAGATLWAIARDRYGDGTLFVRVFDANRDSIVDPHLIYPGQVFALPE